MPGSPIARGFKICGVVMCPFQGQGLLVIDSATLAVVISGDEGIKCGYWTVDGQL